MPLTPTDVHNVGFQKSSLGKRGYDPDEVNEFLDEIERALTHLIEENDQLRAAADSRGPSTLGADQGLLAQHEELQEQVERLRREKTTAEQRVRRLRQELADLRAGRDQKTGGEQEALQILILAQRTADEHVADARREAGTLLSNARARAQQAFDQARATAEALDRDTRVHYQEALGPLEESLSKLQTSIEQLKSFERENHTRLKAYVQSRLEQLESPEEETSSPTNNRAPGGAAPSLPHTPQRPAISTRRRPGQQRERDAG